MDKTRRIDSSKTPSFAKPGKIDARRKWPSQRRKEHAKQVVQALSDAKPISPTIKKFQDLVFNANHVTVYIDETWSGETTGGIRSEGVIAGIICRNQPDTTFPDLPRRQTHLYERPHEIRTAIKELLSCQSCAPFLFPIRLPNTNEPASRHYDLLLQHAIRFLIGWLLPRPKKLKKISIFPEVFRPDDLNQDQTEFYRGLLAAEPQRYCYWQLQTITWKAKDYGYIAYADLMGHLTLEHTDLSKKLGAWANYKELPGYVPFSLDLVPRLERLEHLETSANLQDVLDFALETGDSPFGRLVLDDVAARLAKRPELQQRLLDTLEAIYQEKVRDLSRLRRQFGVFKRLIPTLPKAATPHMRLLWHLLALQDANHDGDPDRIQKAVADYLKERPALRQAEFELCAYADLNLAVHYADRFEFERAEATTRQWLGDPFFRALSPRQQGRMRSASGQYRAMLGEASLAERDFSEALEIFQQACEQGLLNEEEWARERDQTGIYRAINALDGALPDALQRVEDIVGPLAQAAGDLASDDSLEKQYRHYLLVRTLYLLGDSVAEARAVYLNQQAQWRAGAPQHPWPLIHLYRGLLLWESDDDSEEAIEATLSWFSRAIVTAALEVHGATVKLIGAMIATVTACCFADATEMDEQATEDAFDESYPSIARKLLDKARGLPAAARAIETLERILANPDPSAIADALAALPFNYH